MEALSETRSTVNHHAQDDSESQREQLYECAARAAEAQDFAVAAAAMVRTMAASPDKCPADFRALGTVLDKAIEMLQGLDASIDVVITELREVAS